MIAEILLREWDPIGVSDVAEAADDSFKGVSGQRPPDWTGVDPEGKVWVDDGTGNGTSTGHVDDF